MNTKRNLTNVNFRKGRAGKKIEYIVIHNTANNGDTDEGNAKYFHDNKLNASAHYFVDEDSVTQVVLDSDTSWHCADRQNPVAGGGTFKGKCLNSNSLGVELCSDIVAGKLIITEQTQNLGAELVGSKMVEYNLSIEHVIRHFDVSYKKCPQQFVNEPAAWDHFRRKCLWWAVQKKFNLTAEETNYLNYYKYWYNLMTGLLAGKKDFQIDTLRYIYLCHSDKLRDKLGL